MSDIPLIIINVNILCFIVYFICKLNTNDASHFFIFYGYSYLLIWTATGLGFLIGALVPDKNVGLSIMIVIFVSMMLVSGFFVSQDNMIPIMYPIKYISLFKWAFQVYLKNEYNGLTLDCSPSCNPLQSLGFNETMEQSIWATAILGVGYYTLAFLALLLVSHKSRS